MTAFDDLLDHLDREWPLGLPHRLTFHLIGSTALALQAGLRRHTRDGDVLRLQRHGLDDDAVTVLSAAAGHGAELHRRHGVYLEFVHPSLPLMPPTPVFHLDPIPRTHLEVRLLDIVDVCVTKLKRWAPTDRADVSEMVERGLLPHDRFIHRLRETLEHHRFDARIDLFRANATAALREIERDLFALDVLTLLDP